MTSGIRKLIIASNILSCIQIKIYSVFMNIISLFHLHGSKALGGNANESLCGLAAHP